MANQTESWAFLDGKVRHSALDLSCVAGLDTASPSRACGFFCSCRIVLAVRPDPWVQCVIA
jgi:hypothetical protein